MASSQANSIDSLKIDSLQKVLVNQKEDTNKLNTLIYLGRAFWSEKDFTNAVRIANDALSISNNLNFKKGVAAAYDLEAMIYYSQSNYPEALKNLYGQLKIQEEK